MTNPMALEQDNNRAFETTWKERLCSMAKAPEYKVFGTANLAQVTNLDQLEERRMLHTQDTCHDH